jgi:hypothetical protein
MLIPKVIKGFFTEEQLKAIKDEIAFMKEGNDPQVESEYGEFNRRYRHNNPLFKEMHYEIADKVSLLLGTKVKPSYVFCSMYHPSIGICPPHVDRPQCKYTLDVCINQKEPWAINIAGVDYYLEESEAMLYSGTDHWHYRDKIQEGNYCDLVFFHFVHHDFTGPLD